MRFILEKKQSTTLELRHAKDLYRGSTLLKVSPLFPQEDAPHGVSSQGFERTVRTLVISKESYLICNAYPILYERRDRKDQRKEQAC